MHNKVENTTTSLTNIKLPNSAWINFDIAGRVCQPTLPPLLSSSSKSFNVQNSFCDGTKLAMYFIVSSLFAISLHWWQTGSDGPQTGYWNSLHVSSYSGYCKCAEVQFSVTQREESFLSVFPYLSNTRTLLGGEKGLQHTGDSSLRIMKLIIQRPLNFHSQRTQAMPHYIYANSMFWKCYLFLKG